MRNTSRHTGPEPGLHWVALGCFVSAPLWLNGATAFGHLLVALSVALGVTLSLWLTRKEDYAAPVGLYWLFLMVLWTGAQLVPLPLSLLQTLSPLAADQAYETASLLGQTASWAPISMDPGRGATSFLLWACVCGAAFGASRLIAKHGHHEVAWFITGLATLLALIGLGHAAAGADRLFGMYSPVYARPHLLAPLLNDNHLAGFLAASVPLTLELRRRSSETRLRAILSGLALLSATASIATLSRSSLPTLLVGIAAYAALRRTRNKQLSAGWFAGALVVLALGVSLYVGSDAVLSAFTDTDLSKLEVMKQSASLLTNGAPAVGIGRGAFTVAFVQQYGSTWRYEQPENWPLVWLLEWGWLGVLFALGLGRALWRSLLNNNNTGGLALASGAAFVALAVHDLVDFSLEMPGSAVVGALLFASAVTTRRPTRKRQVDARSIPRWARVAPLAVAILVGFSAPLWLLEVDTFERQEELTQRLERGEDISAAAALAVRAHPAEPTFVLLGAADHVSRDTTEAIRWLNRSMQLAPEWPQPHVLSAEWLARRGRITQARLEYREAAGREPRSVRHLTCLLSRAAPHEIEDLLRMVPEGAPEVPLMSQISGCLSLESATSEALDSRILAISPAPPPTIARAVARLQGQEDQPGAQALTEEAFQASPSNIRLGTLLVALLLEAAEPGRAQEVVDELDSQHPGSYEVASLRATIAQARGAFDEMREHLQEMRGLAGVQRDVVIRSYRLAGRLESLSANPSQASDAWEQAFELSGAADDLRRALASANTAQHTRRSYLLRRRLCRIQPESCAPQ